LNRTHLIFYIEVARKLAPEFRLAKPLDNSNIFRQFVEDTGLSNGGIFRFEDYVKKISQDIIKWLVLVFNDII
jgi:hypothetical protein